MTSATGKYALQTQSDVINPPGNRKELMPTRFIIVVSHLVVPFALWICRAKSWRETVGLSRNLVRHTAGILREYQG